VNEHGVPPLIVACTRGDAAMIELLLGAGADVDAVTPDGRRPLLVAARTGRPAAIEALIRHGARVDARDPQQDQTALMWAAADGNTDAVRALLRHGADPRARSKGGWSALAFASRQGHLDVARVLIAAGAPVDDPIGASREGPTALGLATLNAHFELAAALLDAGANPNHTWNGRTVLHAVTWVRKTGAGTNPPPPAGSGSLDSLGFVRRLVAHGANVNARMTVASMGNGLTSSVNMKGATPFLLAARTADADLMRLLAALGADPRAGNEDGSTPLMIAAGLGVESVGEDPGTEEEILEAVKVALALGNDVNAVDAHGETAMHGAAYKAATSTARYLATHGASLAVWNRKNALGWTPLRIADGVHRGMNLRSAPATAAALREILQAAGASTEVDPETNVSGATK
jgi:ankyrin repeat protein